MKKYPCNQMIAALKCADILSQMERQVSNMRDFKAWEDRACDALGELDQADEQDGQNCTWKARAAELEARDEAWKIASGLACDGDPGPITPELLAGFESAMDKAADDIGLACGCADWEYPGQLVRDVKAVVKERDDLSARAERAEARFTAPIVCMCGSTRFKQSWIAENARLTGEGNIVLAVGLWGHHERQHPDEQTKAMLDNLHKRKIDLCDWVWVLDVGGYIGDSTRSEIEYAEELGRPVRYLSKEFPAYEEPTDPVAVQLAAERARWEELREWRRKWISPLNSEAHMVLNYLDHDILDRLSTPADVVRVSIHDGSVPGCQVGRPCGDGACEEMYGGHIDDIDATGDTLYLVRRKP